MDSNLLYKFFEGLTSKDENELIRNWLDSSPDNKKHFLEERRIYDAIILNTGPDDIEELKRGRSYKNPESNKRSLLLKEFFKIAAIVFITFLGSAYYFSSQNDDNNSGIQTITVPAGQRMNITLSDGTNVWLNAKTKIQYPVSFNKKERLIHLEGQAFFDVAKNKKPFIVKTKNGTIEALGTKFDALDYPDDNKFEIMLAEGSVKIDLADKPSGSTVLSPNNKAVLNDGKLITSQVTDQNPYMWKDGLIGFKNETIENIMQSFEKMYDIKIIIENKKIQGPTYTGKFRMVDGVDYALRVLQRDVKFKYERDNENHIIYIK